MVEIKELIIKTRIDEKKTTGEENLSLEQKTQEIIRCCVEEVLRILKRERER